MSEITDAQIEAAMPTMMRLCEDSDERSELSWYENWMPWAKSMPHQHRMAITCVRCEWEDVFAKTRDVLLAAQPTSAAPVMKQEVCLHQFFGTAFSDGSCDMTCQKCGLRSYSPPRDTSAAPVDGGDASG